MKKLFVAALLCSPFAQASNGSIEAPIAKALVAKTIEQVEAKALLPASQADYDAARQRLQAFVAGSAASFDRKQLYRVVNAMLATIDSDGHTMLWSREVTQRAERSVPSLDVIPSQVRVVDTAHGAALVVNPPAISTSEPKAMQNYVAAMLQGIANAEGLARSCALVVDLSGQTGGNAWPPMLVLEPLFSAHNTARFADRDNQRTQIAAPAIFRNFKKRVGNVPANALARFREQPYGVVYAQDTASAGEMIAIALQGEPGRSRSFGTQTYGMTTANVPVEMPDNALLLLTTERYALGDQPVLRGKLAPDVATAPQQAVQQAAEWASAQSPACKAKVAAR